MRRIECQYAFFVRSSLLIYILFKFYVFLIVLFNSRGFVAVTLLQNHFSSFLLSEILVVLSSFLLREFFRVLQVATIAWFEADSVCGSHSVAIPLVLVLPYLFRLFQCLRQYKDTGEKTTLLNGMLTWPFFLMFLAMVYLWLQFVTSICLTIFSSPWPYQLINAFETQ